ncbi:unnamed protein product, partial [Discosporangium mesarthrocarpum]
RFGKGRSCVCFPKSLVLVFRDVEEEEDLRVLEVAARRNMQDMWQATDMPNSLREQGLSAVFDLHMYGFPHYQYQRRGFVTKASELRQAFSDPECEGMP